MFDTTIAGKCCSRPFIAVTETAPKVGDLVKCKHCNEIIELDKSNAITSEMTEAEWAEFKAMAG